MGKVKEFIEDVLKGPGSRKPKPKRSLLGDAMKGAKAKQLIKINEKGPLKAVVKRNKALKDALDRTNGKTKDKNGTYE